MVTLTRLNIKLHVTFLVDVWYNVVRQKSFIYAAYQRKRQKYVWCNEARSCYHCCSGKAINISHSECVFVALSIQHAMRMRYIVIWPLRLYSICLPYPINGMIFAKKRFLNIKFMFWHSLQLLLETFLILWRNDRHMIKNCMLLLM